MNTHAVEVGARIARYRKTVGLSAQALADRAGLTRAVVVNLEHPERTRDLTWVELSKISAALGVPPLALVFDLLAPLDEIEVEGWTMSTLTAVQQSAGFAVGPHTTELGRAVVRAVDIAESLAATRVRIGEVVDSLAERLSAHEIRDAAAGLLPPGLDDDDRGERGFLADLVTSHRHYATAMQSVGATVPGGDPVELAISRRFPHGKR